MRRRILFISTEYPKETGIGGIGTYVYNAANGLRLLDDNLIISVLSVSFREQREYVENGINVIRLKINKSNPFSSYFFITKWLLKNYKRYDLIEDQVFGGYIFFAKFILGKKLRYVARLHGTSHEVRVLERDFGTGALLKNRVADFFEKYVVRNAQLIINDSFFLGLYSFMLWNIDFGRLNSLPLPFDFKYVNGEEFNEKLSALENKNFLLFYGRIQRKKGSQVAEKIVDAILGKYSDLNIVMFGGDKVGLVNKYKNNSRVMHIDHIYDKKLMYSIVKKAKIVILPSQFEAFLYTAVEAIALGRPTIISGNCGVVKYITTDKKYNNIVDDFNNPDAYLKKIDSILSNYESALKQTMTQKEYLEHVLAPESIARAYLDLVDRNF